MYIEPPQLYKKKIPNQLSGTNITCVQSFHFLYTDNLSCDVLGP
jgi:hypothetical protein